MGKKSFIESRLLDLYPWTWFDPLLLHFIIHQYLTELPIKLLNHPHGSCKLGCRDMGNQSSERPPYRRTSRPLLFQFAAERQKYFTASQVRIKQLMNWFHLF
uniref:Uncharacterized protein n=1 Tax=Arundo donax TaxID=35708 RepID=A0A0A9CZ22_ARUDO